MGEMKRPGGELASRPLHFFWIVDCSGSMYGDPSENWAHTPLPHNNPRIPP